MLWFMAGPGKIEVIAAKYSFREADGIFPVSSGNRKSKNQTIL
jgi:hypothetical protein